MIQVAQVVYGEVIMHPNMFAVVLAVAIDNRPGPLWWKWFQTEYTAIRRLLKVSTIVTAHDVIELCDSNFLHIYKASPE